MSSLFDTNVAEETFYGFRVSDKGNLKIEIIDDDSAVIVDETDLTIDKDAYQMTLWSEDTMRFNFNNKGHLLVSVL
jgi:hypothetical protein